VIVYVIPEYAECMAVDLIHLCLKWHLSARLETRTKESNVFASRWVENPKA
jgi:hypothetical protein